MRLGPEEAALLVRTRREGAAAALGHDLLLELTRWEADVGEDAVSLDVDPTAIAIREGPAGGRDREQILRNIEAKVLGDRPIRFRSTAVDREGDRLRLRGDLTIAGVVRPISFAVDLAGPTAKVTLRQSEWGIKPFSAMMGALRVRDEVEVSLRVQQNHPGG